jgi:hypothetical protein
LFFPITRDAGDYGDLNHALPQARDGGGKENRARHAIRNQA